MEIDNSSFFLNIVVTMNPSPKSPTAETKETVARIKINKPNELLKHGLLLCGVLSSVLYVGFDIFAASRYPGYNYTSQTISELFGREAPTRTIELLFGPVYAVLVLAFALGTWMSSGGRRSLQLAASALVVFALINQVNLAYFPLHMRGAEHTATDTMHVIFTAVTGLLMLLVVFFGAIHYGTHFRLYSTITVILLLVFGSLAGIDGPKLHTNEPTPWMGIAERINVYAYMLWVIVFAVRLFRRGKRSVVIEQPLATVVNN